jgi:hypothetical protein
LALWVGRSDINLSLSCGLLTATESSHDQRDTNSQTKPFSLRTTFYVHALYPSQQPAAALFFFVSAPSRRASSLTQMMQRP